MRAFHVTIGDGATALWRLRRSLTAWLDEVGVPDPPRADLVLATHEAAANAVEHADPSGPVVVDGLRDGDVVVIEVSDRGRWKPRAVPSPEERGRGLELIGWLVADAEVLAGARGTTIRLRHTVPSRRAAGGPRPSVAA